MSYFYGKNIDTSLLEIIVWFKKDVTSLKRTGIV